MVSHSRARLLNAIGINTISNVASANPELVRTHPKVMYSKDITFPTAFPLIIKYAQAISSKTPLVVGSHPAFSNPPRSPYYMDLEYDPQGTGTAGEVGIFVYGIMNSDGHIVQRFLDDPKKERDHVEWFLSWLSKHRTVLITYASKSADEPHLRNSLHKFNLPSEALSEARFLDLYFDVIFTRSPDTQKIFLPLKDMGSKNVAEYFGFREPKNIRIHDGLGALMAYNRYVRSKRKRIRKDILAYNRCDLRRIKVIYERLGQSFEEYHNTGKEDTV